MRNLCLRIWYERSDTLNTGREIIRVLLSTAFVERMRLDVALALALNTEKARSEFIIAPVLAELRCTLGGQFGLFSEIEFNVDPARGLNGDCDVILTRSALQLVLTAPVVVIAEAKNDNLRTGLGQCIAAMGAAQAFNVQAKVPIAQVHGVVTTGSAWKFLRLRAAELTLDEREYFITELGRIMGILAHCVQASPEL
jgi:hypothetical protein